MSVPAVCNGEDNEPVLVPQSVEPGVDGQQWGHPDGQHRDIQEKRLRVPHWWTGWGGGFLCFFCNNNMLMYKYGIKFLMLCWCNSCVSFVIIICWCDSCVSFVIIICWCDSCVSFVIIICWCDSCVSIVIIICWCINME